MAMLKHQDEAPAPRGGELNALLGKGSEFEGKLTFEGTVRIDGKFHGEIFTKDTLVIGEGATVSAEISAGTVVINGEMIGNVRAVQAVDMRHPARVKGNIETPSLVIEKGVLFEGHCKMENLGKGAAPAAKLPLEGPREAVRLPKEVSGA